MKILVFFLAKCVRTAAKTMVVDRKSQKALALLYLASGPLRNAANSSVVPTEFAAEPTVKIKSLKVNSKLAIFAFHQKDNWVFFWTFFFPLIKLLLTFVFFAKTRVTMRFRTKNARYSTGLYQVYATSYWWPSSADRRTVTWLLRHYQNFLAW